MLLAIGETGVARIAHCSQDKSLGNWAIKKAHLHLLSELASARNRCTLLGTFRPVKKLSDPRNKEIPTRMSASRYDIVTVGGGIGASALAARHG